MHAPYSRTRQHSSRATSSLLRNVKRCLGQIGKGFLSLVSYPTSSTATSCCTAWRPRRFLRQSRHHIRGGVSWHAFVEIAMARLAHLVNARERGHPAQVCHLRYRLPPSCACVRGYGARCGAHRFSRATCRCCTVSDHRSFSTILIKDSSWSATFARGTNRRHYRLYETERSPFILDGWAESERQERMRLLPRNETRSERD